MFSTHSQRGRGSILYVLVACGALTVALAWPAGVEAEVMKVSWVQATCEVEPGTTWTSGKESQRLHLRSEVHRDVMMWADGTSFGTNTIVFDFDVKLANGRGIASGTFNAWPSSLSDGCWIGTFDGKLKKFMLSATVEGVGTGELAGTRLRGEIRQFVPTAAQAATLCGGDEVYKAVRVSATIRDAE